MYSCLDGYIAETACVLEKDDQEWVYYSKTYTNDIGNVCSGRAGVLLPGPDSNTYREECLRRGRCNSWETNLSDLERSAERL